jgi:hypothetical protein
MGPINEIPQTENRVVGGMGGDGPVANRGLFRTPVPKR